MSIQAQRLLNVALALRESRNPDQFQMGCYVNGCGTPACAIGHYASRADLQDLFAIRNGDDFVYADSTPDWEYGGLADYDDDRVLEHFGITAYEAEALFGGRGCDYAKTANEAADFIERFVKRKWGIDPAVRRLERELTTEIPTQEYVAAELTEHSR